MSENQGTDLPSFVRRFWWVFGIVAVLLMCVCGYTQQQQILNLINPPVPTEDVTQPPNDTVTEPAKTDEPTDEPTDNPTDEPTDEPTDDPNQPGNGACNSSCNQDSDCLAGLSCEPSSANPNQSICWNFDICVEGDVTQPPGGGDCHCEGIDLVCDTGTISNSQQCGGTGCHCEGTTLVCDDGTNAPFNPACGVNPGTSGGSCSYTCFNGMCESACGENYGNCPYDCP